MNERIVSAEYWHSLLVGLRAQSAHKGWRDEWDNATPNALRMRNLFARFHVSFHIHIQSNKLPIKVTTGVVRSFIRRSVECCTFGIIQRPYCCRFVVCHAGRVWEKKAEKRGSTTAAKDKE
jgi:hypothetical protein